MLTHAHPLPVQNPLDVADLRALYRRLLDGWNRGTGQGFAAAFTKEADLVRGDGLHIAGREEITKVYALLLDTLLRGTRLVGTVQRLRFLEPEIAVVHAVGGMVVPWRAESSVERTMKQTLVARKRDGAWRFEAIQCTYAPQLSPSDLVQALEQESPSAK